MAWGIVIVFPERSPFGPLSTKERACQRVVLGVSAGAREAYRAGTLAERRMTFIDELEALDPPNDWWRSVKAAQLLDMRADPPKVGVGDATQRLVTWPWRVALDHRIIGPRLRLEDAIRARRLRRNPRPGFEEMTTSLRYNYYFLRIVLNRFADLRTREGGLSRWHDNAAALLELAREVRAPTSGWARLRDLIVEIHGGELKASSTELNPAEQERLAITTEEASRAWLEMERRDAAGLASAR